MKRWLIIVLFAFLITFSGFLITKVEVNYNLQEYLPADSEIVSGINQFETEFGVSSTAYISIDESDLSEALNIKTELTNLNNVKEVIFVDTYLNELTYSIIRSNLTTEQQLVVDGFLNSLLMQGKTFPLAIYELANYFPEETKIYIQDLYSEYVSEDYVLYQVVFATKASDPLTEETLEVIESSLEEAGYQVFSKGESVSNIFTKNTINQETTLITIIIVKQIIF